jgi:L-fuculose-phosphate aldolase
MSEKDLVIQELIVAGARLDHRKLFAGNDGNLSTRLSDSTIIITARGKFKGRLSKEDFFHIDIDGNVLAGKGRPSSETEAHLVFYRNRDDISAVIHTHPPHVVAMTLKGETLEAVHMAEAAYSFGSVPTLPYTVPGTEEGGRSMSKWVKSRDAMLLERHGAVCCGRDIWDAVARTEMIEAVASEILLAGGNDKVKPFTWDEIERTYQVVSKADTTNPDSLSDWRDKLLDSIK